MAGQTQAGAARPRRGVHKIAVVVLIVGLIATGSLSFAAYTVHDRNENRLLSQRAREVGFNLVAPVPTLEVSLTTAAQIVDQTGGQPAVFEQLFASVTGRGQPFVSTSVWRMDGGAPEPIVVLGRQPTLADQPTGQVEAYFRRAIRSGALSVYSLLRTGHPGLGYAVSTNGGSPHYVVYVETTVPKHRTNMERDDVAFRNLEYAVYVGRRELTPDLLSASTPSVPLGGRRAEVTVPYGDTSLHLVVSPRRDQGGELLRLLPLLIAVVGTLVSLGFAALTERLLRGREDAQLLAVENASLFAAQRTVAVTLQHSLLPDHLPDVGGLELGVRYEPGVDGIDVGGDWYDVWPVTNDRVIVVVGDVSGRGLRPATIMASLRHAIRAYAADGDGPGTILTKVNGLIDIESDGHFATVTCAEVDVPRRTITLANAGHPAPLLVSDGDTRFLVTPPGVALGVVAGFRYESRSETLPPGATLLAYTDGLFERRGESLDAGFERLRSSADRPGLPLEELLDAICADLVQPSSRDDTALLGIRLR